MPPTPLAKSPPGRAFRRPPCATTRTSGCQTRHSNRRRVSHLRRPDPRAARLHCAGQAAGLFDRRDHRPGRDLGRRPVRPVQRRFHELVTDKIHAAQNQIANSPRSPPNSSPWPPSSGRTNRRALRRRLRLRCRRAREGEGSMITLGSKPDDIPIACTLEPGAMGIGSRSGRRCSTGHATQHRTRWRAAHRVLRRRPRTS